MPEGQIWQVCCFRKRHFLRLELKECREDFLHKARGIRKRAVKSGKSIDTRSLEADRHCLEADIRLSCQICLTEEERLLSLDYTLVSPIFKDSYMIFPLSFTEVSGYVLHVMNFYTACVAFVVVVVAVI